MCCYAQAAVLLLLCFVGIGHTQDNSPSVNDLLPGKQAPTNRATPVPTAKSAGDIAKLRAYYDETVWAKELEAQQFESVIVRFWDELRTAANPFEVLSNLAVESWVLGKKPSASDLENGIVRTVFAEQSQLSANEFRTQSDRLRKAGFVIEGSEFRQLEFRNDTGQSAQSIVSVRLNVKRSNLRMIVQGKAKVTWTGQPTGKASDLKPARVELRDIEILSRDGMPALTSAMRIPYSLPGKRSKLTMHSIRPILVVDLNGDDLPEIALPSLNEVWWNRSRWRFAKQALFSHPKPGITTAIACDVNGDKQIDILAAGRGAVMLYPGDDKGAFTRAPSLFAFQDVTLRSPTSMTAGDIDHDGDLDIFIGQSRETHLLGDIPTPYFDATDGYGNVLLQNDGAGKFVDATSSAGIGKLAKRRTTSATFVDLDHDGDLDLLTTSDFAGSEHYINDGQGNFANGTRLLGDSTIGLGQGHTLSDFDGNGRIDLLSLGVSSAAALRLQQLKLRRKDFAKYDQLRARMASGSQLLGQNVSSATQPETIHTGWPLGATSSDFDRNGFPDAFVVNGRLSGDTAQDYDSRFWCHDIYFRPENRPVKAIRQYFARFAPLFGKLFSWHGFENNALLMRVDGKRFVDVGYLMIDADPQNDSRCAVSADLDQDGRMDLIYEEVQHGSDESMLRVMKNASLDGNHWIGLNISGANKLAESVGLRVTLQLPNGNALCHHATIGNGTGVQGPHSIHFGIGAAEKVASIDLVWADGTKQRIDSPAIDRYHRIAK